MCIAAPGKIVKINGKQADVDYGSGIIRTVLVADQKIHMDDYVLVQMGIIINVLSKEEAYSVEKAWKDHTILSS